MRWVFYFLIIVNAAYFTWSLYNREDVEINTEKHQKENDQIVLINEGSLGSERVSDKDKSKTQQIDKAISNKPLDEHSSKSVEVSIPAQNTTSIIEPLIDLTQNELAKNNDSQAISIDSESAVDVKQEKTVPLVQDLVNQQVSVDKISNQHETGDVIDSDDYCALVSKVSEENDQTFRDWMIENDITFSTEESELEEVRGYILYYAPLPSREEALSMLENFKQDGIDSYLITKGDLKNAIALGLYSTENNAMRKMAEFIESGIDEVDFIPRYRKRKVFEHKISVKLLKEKEIFVKEVRSKVFEAKINEIPCF